LTDESATNPPGDYEAKFCDLENNYLGYWETDQSTYCLWTMYDPSLLPENFIIVAENIEGEGLYGTKVDGDNVITDRSPDNDGTTLADFDCEGIEGSKIFYTYHLDHLGSVRLVTDENGDVVWPADFNDNGPARYTPFGELYKPSSRPYFEEDVLTAIQFTSKERDTETQLSYFGARYLEHEYPPRFITADPSLSGSFNLENPQTFNLYTYCLNNPLNRKATSERQSRGRGRQIRPPLPVTSGYRHNDEKP